MRPESSVCRSRSSGLIKYLAPLDDLSLIHVNAGGRAKGRRRLGRGVRSQAAASMRDEQGSANSKALFQTAVSARKKRPNQRLHPYWAASPDTSPWRSATAIPNRRETRSFRMSQSGRNPSSELAHPTCGPACCRTRVPSLGFQPKARLRPSQPDLRQRQTRGTHRLDGLLRGDIVDSKP